MKNIIFFALILIIVMIILFWPTQSSQFLILLKILLGLGFSALALKAINSTPMLKLGMQSNKTGPFAKLANAAK